MTEEGAALERDAGVDQETDAIVTVAALRIGTGAGPGIGTGAGLERTRRREGVDPEREENLMKMDARDLALVKIGEEREVTREIEQRRDHVSKGADHVIERGADPVSEGTRGVGRVIERGADPLSEGTRVVGLATAAGVTRGKVH